MNYALSSVKFFSIFFAYLYSISCSAIDSAIIEQKANSSINELYHTLNAMPNASMVERIDWISKQFKGTVYILGSLGEGPQARYDQFPRYRMDGFDCDTYVNTVIALAIANSLTTFQQCLKSIRYKDGKIAYINRNHFTDLDWNRNNQHIGILKDITLNFRDKNHKAIAKMAEALINKPSWYAHKTIENIRVQPDDQMTRNKRLTELKAKGSKLKIDTAKIPYLPFSALFSNNLEPNLYLFSQIPDGAIVEIVRPNWDLRERIGTSLNISHLGFAIWSNKKLYFRQASSQYGKIVDVPLIDYLQEQTRTSPTIKGINIQVLVPTKTKSNGCSSFKTT